MGRGGGGGRSLSTFTAGQLHPAATLNTEIHKNSVRITAQSMHQIENIKIKLITMINKEAICNHRRLWSDCADAQSDLSLHWLYKSYCRFCCVLAHLYFDYCICVVVSGYYTFLIPSSFSASWGLCFVILVFSGNFIYNFGIILSN